MKEEVGRSRVLGLSQSGSLLLAILAVILVPGAGQAETFTVNTTSDDPLPGGACSTPSGPCSLRAAIEAANSNPGGDRILFSLVPSDPGYGSGYWTIEPTSQLPSIDDALLIDGTSQSGAGCAAAAGEPHRLLVRLEGWRVPATPLSEPGLRVGFRADRVTVRGLSITGFPGPGVSLSGAGDVQCCYLGLTPDGSPGGNADGVSVSGSGSYIGGRAHAERNVISGNQGEGIGGYGEDLRIEGNYIGTDPTGAARHPVTQLVGVYLDGSSGTVVGVAASGGGNLISGNRYGIEVGRFRPTFDVTIRANQIGTDLTGMLALPNTEDGLVINAPDVVVGGEAAGQGNVISGNGEDGIYIRPDSKRPLVQGNKIGVAVDGSPMGNGGNGVINWGTIGTFGGPGGAANVIAHNFRKGILVRSDPDSEAEASARILENSIHSNGSIGIDILGAVSSVNVTPNDPRDATNPHALNWPTVTSATSDGSSSTIVGGLNSFPGSSFDLRFFASEVPDPSGHGEGQVFLGVHRVSTDGSGDASFSTVLPTPAPAGWFVCATSTTVSGMLYTSEFGPVVGAVVVGGSGGPVPSMAKSVGAIALALMLALVFVWRRRVS